MSEREPGQMGSNSSQASPGESGVIEAPVVLVHGLIGHLKSLARHPALATLSAGIIAPDLLGYGAKVDTPLEQITLAAQAEALGHEIERVFGHDRVHLVGHSLGGTIAMLFAASAPERIASVINIEGNFTLDDAFWSASFGRMRLSEVETVLATLRADPKAWLARSMPSPSPEAVTVAKQWLSHQPASTLQAMGRAVLAETGLETYLDTIKTVFQRQTVHLVCGERTRDEWHVPAWARELAASEHIVDGAGHLLMLEEMDYVAEWLAWRLGTTSAGS
jgi:lipase